eukprot:4961467-Amphidinium_carterae.1
MVEHIFRYFCKEEERGREAAHCPWESGVSFEGFLSNSFLETGQETPTKLLDLSGCLDSSMVSWARMWVQFWCDGSVGLELWSLRVPRRRADGKPSLCANGHRLFWLQKRHEHLPLYPSTQIIANCLQSVLEYF